MIIRSIFVMLLALSILLSHARGQQLPKSGKTRLPLSVSQLPNLISGPIKTGHLAFNRLSGSTQAATLAPASKTVTIKSIPFFNSSFTFQSQTFPFTMLGGPPEKGRTTRIGTSYLAISFIFDEFVDSNGKNIVIDATGNTEILLNGPNFERFPYGTGYTQFSDAVQRAEFSNVMKGAGGGNPDDGWHTLLKRPRRFKPVTVEVPFFDSLVFQLPDGTVFALIDFNFLTSQLNTLIQTENLRPDEVPIFVTHNTVYGDFFAGTLLNCCIGGFHTAFESQPSNNTVSIQVFAFATSFDAPASSALFGDATAFADVEAFSHEISELYNDPFVNNTVPSWQVSGASAGACSNLLETGDPVESLSNAFFPVMINNFIYHPQTEALLQWFSRESPSRAFQGDFSYPGGNLTSPSQACPAGH